MTDKTTANKILDQLGGKRFGVLAGVKKAFGTTNSVSFKLPNAKTKINYVKVELTAKNDYVVEFATNTHGDYKIVAKLTGITLETIKQTFTEQTGIAI